VCRVDYVDARGHGHLGLISDLSSGGMFVKYAAGLSVGDQVVAAFALPYGPPLKLKATVIRVTPLGAGMKLLGLSEWGRSSYPDSLEMYCAALYTAWLDAMAHPERELDPEEDAVEQPATLQAKTNLPYRRGSRLYQRDLDAH
jgi:hypothetical protein